MITWKTILWTILVGGSFTAYILYLRDKKRALIQQEKNKSIGKAKISGNFDLINQFNVPVKSEDLYGKWLLVYFGFTHCPDVCPDEIEKMVKVVDLIDEKSWGHEIKPVFITVDPERDSPAAVGKYVKEFSDKIIGLTGTKEQVDKACKSFRVYYSAGPRDSDNDYIVDHTIIIYFIGPNGDFIDYFSQNKTAEQIVNEIEFFMKKHDFLKSKGIISRLRTLI